MNINQVLETLTRHESELGAHLGHMDEHLAKLVEMQNTLIRADVRGGIDVDFAIGVGATSPDNQTVGQVIHQFKAEDGLLYGVVTFNADSAARYARFYQGGVPPRVGYTPMRFPIGLPTGSGAVFFGSIGIPFKDGIWVAATAGITDVSADIASPTANTVLVVAFYK